MRRVAGPQDDDWNADSHERWTKCCDLAMLVVFLVAVIAAAADAHIAAIGAALVAAVAAAATAFAAAVTAGLLGMFFGPARATQPCWYWQW